MSERENTIFSQEKTLYGVDNGGSNRYNTPLPEELSHPIWRVERPDKKAAAGMKFSEMKATSAAGTAGRAYNMNKGATHVGAVA